MTDFLTRDIFKAGLVSEGSLTVAGITNSGSLATVGITNTGSMSQQGQLYMAGSSTVNRLIYWPSTLSVLTTEDDGTFILTDENISGRRRLRIADPTEPSHAATKNYVDTPNPAYLKNGDWTMNNNPFGGRRLFQSEHHNAFFLADKRWTVTGNLYQKSGGTFLRSLTASEIAIMFDGNYESFFQIDLGRYLVLNINFGNTPTGYFPAYPYGDIYVSSYYNYSSSAITARMYCDFAAQTVGWKDLSPVEVPTSYGFARQIFKINNQFYNMRDFEITYTAPDTGNPASINQIDFAMERPSSSNEFPVVDKYRPNTLYRSLTIKHDQTFSSDLMFDSPPAQSSYQQWQTNGNLRWALGKTGTAESGGDVGSDFGVYRYSDAGGFLGAPLVIMRETGEVRLGVDPTTSMGAATKQYVDSKVGSGGGGGLDQATADGLYVNITGDTVTGALTLTNANQLVTPFTINRTATSTSTSDADTFQVNYLGTRTTWTNEKGNLRTSNQASKGEIAFKVVGAATAEGGTTDMMQVTDLAGNIMTRIGSLGRQNFNKGIRMVGDTIQIRDSTEVDESTISQPLGGALTILPKTSMSLSSKKITSLADGTVATDAAAFGQIGAAVTAHAATAGHELLSSTTPAALGTAAVGVGTTTARADHVHQLPSLATLGAAATSHTHVIGDLPTGTTGTTVALGNHTHTAASLSVLPLTADTAAPLTGDLYLSAASAVSRALVFGGVSTARRWEISKTAVAESGSNVGSDFAITRRSDTGVALDSPVVIKRSTGDVTMTSNLSLQGPVATWRNLGFGTGTSVRWEIGKSSSSETGSNAGSDFVIDRHADTGAYVDSPFQIYRDSGDVVLGKTLWLTSGTSPSGATAVPNKGYVDARTPKITVATTAPSSPALNDIWVDSSP